MPPSRHPFPLRITLSSMLCLPLAPTLPARADVPPPLPEPTPTPTPAPTPAPTPTPTAPPAPSISLPKPFELDPSTGLIPSAIDALSQTLLIDPSKPPIPLTLNLEPFRAQGSGLNDADMHLLSTLGLSNASSISLLLQPSSSPTSNANLPLHTLTIAAKSRAAPNSASPTIITLPTPTPALSPPAISIFRSASVILPIDTGPAGTSTFVINDLPLTLSALLFQSAQLYRAANNLPPLPRSTFQATADQRRALATSLSTSITLARFSDQPALHLFIPARTRTTQSELAQALSAVLTNLPPDTLTTKGFTSTLKLQLPSAASPLELIISVLPPQPQSKPAASQSAPMPQVPALLATLAPASTNPLASHNNLTEQYNKPN